MKVNQITQKYCKLLQIDSILRSTPLKKNPDYIAYRVPRKNLYYLADTKGNNVGNMVAYPEYIYENRTYYPVIKNYSSLYIYNLYIKPQFRRMKAGESLLYIAAQESYRRNCEGRVHLIAQNFKDGGKPPQKFYRKNNYDSQNKYHIEIIDKSIKENTELPKGNINWSTPMFLRFNSPKWQPFSLVKQFLFHQ